MKTALKVKGEDSCEKLMFDYAQVEQLSSALLLY